MKWRMVIGVEGCGHHMIMDICDGLIPVDVPLERSMLGFWEERENFNTEWLNGRENLLLAINSFPYDNPRNPLKRPSLPAIFTMPVETRLLFLKRSAAACVRSALRRGFTDDANLQCRIVEDQLAYLLCFLPQFNPKYLKCARYEDFIEHPEKMCKKLADWFDEPLIAERWSVVKRPVHKQDITQEQEHAIESFWMKAARYPMITELGAFVDNNHI